MLRRSVSNIFRATPFRRRRLIGLPPPARLSRPVPFEHRSDGEKRLPVVDVTITQCSGEGAVRQPSLNRGADGLLMPEQAEGKARSTERLDLLGTQRLRLRRCRVPSGAVDQTGARRSSIGIERSSVGGRLWPIPAYADGRKSGERGGDLRLTIWRRLAAYHYCSSCNCARY